MLFSEDQLTKIIFFWLFACINLFKLMQQFCRVVTWAKTVVKCPINFWPLLSVSAFCCWKYSCREKSCKLRRFDSQGKLWGNFSINIIICLQITTSIYKRKPFVMSDRLSVVLTKLWLIPNSLHGSLFPFILMQATRTMVRTIWTTLSCLVGWSKFCHETFSSTLSFHIILINWAAKVSFKQKWNLLLNKLQDLTWNPASKSLVRPDFQSSLSL